LDEAGNVMHLLNDNGYATSHLVYDAWGQLMSGSNPTPYGDKGQWGYYTDAETGFLLLTHRYLDPAVGRFLTRDPIGLEGGINLYAYVGNGVVDAYDSTETIVRFCYRPVLRAIRGKPACHWFLWTSCGTRGYGSGGIMNT
jgi:RHS repeat-associated protein